MEDVLALVEEILAQHKLIMQGVRTLEQVANDAQAIESLEKAKDAFMPGRLEQKQGLQELQERLATIEKGIKAHFDLEEDKLQTALEKHGDNETVSALHSVFLEHEDLRNRLAHSKRHVADLIGGGLSRHLWEASAHDMRAHLTHTRKLLEAHAQIEQELLKQLKDQLQREAN
ncbi:hypothetical protein ACFLW4_03400 [Chloroflexota bacterium]